MAIQECENGHLYDPDQHKSCPYCQGGNVRIDFGAAGVGKTVATAAAVSSSEIGATVAPANYINRPVPADLGRTVGILQKRMRHEPVVGWLVCIDGPEKGRDFRIYGKNNSIGRSDKMDICIRGEATVSRENHAMLAYDDKHNTFHLVPSEGTNTVYLNDEPVYVPTQLTIYDIIEFGESKLLFIPFCNEHFTWQNGLIRD